MLFGEHAVVYGHPCIVTAISERLFVTEGDPVGDTRFLDAAIKLWGNPTTKLSATCAFSGKYGLGSSSAVTVAALKALKPDASNKEIFDAAYKIVLDIQGTGSGFDVGAATYGGTLYYIKNKTIESLVIKDMPLIVGYTGVKADTKTLVADVAAKRANEPGKVDRIFRAIGKIVEEAKGKMIEGDWERVGRLMDFNQEYLRDLGVSSEKLEALIRAAKGAGAWGAKLSGAGCGDCMIALAPPEKRKAVEEAITRAGGEVVNIASSAPGVRVEATDNQKELFVVVDKDDHILGHKTRYECLHNKTLIHRAVELFVFDKNGRVLLQKRSITKDTDPGVWSPSVGGHVDPGESYEQAMKRETKEELGIEVSMKYIRTSLVDFQNETEMEALFTAIHDGPFTPDHDEAEEVRFFEKRELSLLVASRKLRLTAAAENNLKYLGLL